ELGLEKVDHLLEDEVVVGEDGDGFLVSRHLALGLLQVVAGLDLAAGLVDGVGDRLRIHLAGDVEGVLRFRHDRYCLMTATPGGGEKTKSLSASPGFTFMSRNRTVTVFPSSSNTTALRTSPLARSTDTTSRASMGCGSRGVRSRTTRPSPSMGWAGFRKRA